MKYLFVALAAWTIIGVWYAMYNLGEKPGQPKWAQYFDLAVMAPVFAFFIAVGVIRKLIGR